VVLLLKILKKIPPAANASEYYVQHYSAEVCQIIFGHTFPRQYLKFAGKQIARNATAAIFNTHRPQAGHGRKRAFKIFFAQLL
jgi:hypothetical protein